MDISLFDYNLPKENIAHSPSIKRDESRLLSINRQTGDLKDYIFKDIVDLLTSNDVLVFNKTKVFPARLIGKKETGGNIEILLLKNIGDNTWEALRKGKVKINQKIIFKNNSGLVTEIKENFIKIVFDKPPKGLVPLPPYIKTKLTQSELQKRYQTVYAQNMGSVAAPTAGLHFTDELIQKLKAKGVQLEYITLHVGLGTFLPVKTKKLEDHLMHEEYFEIDSDTAKHLKEAKSNNKRIIAVGTTTARALESESSPTNIFIYPPYKFKMVDALITNFHLPKSTLLALVSAFVSYPQTDKKFTSFKNSLVGKAYVHAIAKTYRFYSFGDACFIF